MFYYIENKNTNPYYNLALEQFVFDSLDTSKNYFFLWQNNNAVIAGKNQDTMREINDLFVKNNNICVARRISGGGAVYHDLGNVNFTFITDAVNEDKIDIMPFCAIIQKALCAMGVPCILKGRNDITVDGYKVSGSAQYYKGGRILHHGTLLYDTNLKMLYAALDNSKSCETSGKSGKIKSVKSEVSNIKPFAKKELSVLDFINELKNYFINEYNMREFKLNDEHIKKICELKREKYEDLNWIYGSTYNDDYEGKTIKKECRIKECGFICAQIKIDSNNKIFDISFKGDFFGTENIEELEKKLKGCPFEYSYIKDIIKSVNISRYFHNLSNVSFLEILFDVG